MGKKHTEPRLCACGCGQWTKQTRNGKYNKYCLGHNTKHGKDEGRSKNGRFTAGNSFGQGRPCGSRNSVSVASGNLIEGEAEALSRKLVELALDGNVACLRAAIDRIHPPRKSSPVKLANMPTVTDISSAEKAVCYLLLEVAEGRLSPADAETVSRLLDKYVGICKWSDVEEQLHQLQERFDAR